METGMVHLYIGDGKGKTTAALGLLARAYGAGLSCLFVQFLKGGETAELKMLEKLGVPVIRTEDVKKFVAFMDEKELELCKKSHQECFEKLLDTVKKQNVDLVVLDEALDAVSLGMVSEAELVNFLKHQKGTTEVVLTGRNPGQAMVELADYITEMKKIKHPYEQGVTARKGIEF